MSPSSWTRIRELHGQRPRSRLVRVSVALLALLGVGSWFSGEIAVGDLLSERRRDNFERFLTEDLMPYPLRGAGFSWSGLAEWVLGVLREPGLAATLATLAISALAIVLAALLALPPALLGARTLATRSPYRLGDAPRGAGWRLLSGSTRFVCILLRALPEYVWAFLLLAMLGASAWPVVLALAVHNAGILGRLGSDTVENLEAAPLRALRAAGATRGQIALGAVLPIALPRFLLYFFYRFETCVREATVLGMLGVVSLGYWIQDARGRGNYDEMLLLVLLGAVLVLAADVASQVARAWIRRAV